MITVLPISTSLVDVDDKSSNHGSSIGRSNNSNTNHDNISSKTNGNSTQWSHFKNDSNDKHPKYATQKIRKPNFKNLVDIEVVLTVVSI